MLSLKKKKDFNKAYKGKTIAGKLIFLKAQKNNLDVSRFGFVVSSKISKKAVIRNKIKRRLREVVKDFKKGFDIIIIVKPEIINKTYQEIKSDFKNVIKNI